MNRAIATGNFDGCHLGHQKLFTFLKQKAQDAGLKPMIVSFEPHTRYLLGAPGKPPLLTTSLEKKEFIESFGLSFASIPFTHALTQKSFETFLEQNLKKAFNASLFVFGHDHKMGSKGKGDFESIVQAFPNLAVYQMQAFYHHNKLVSSSLIREELAKGHITSANSFLGRPYRLSGEVVLGKQLGRQLGFPTANLQTEAFKLIPRFGVYAGEATLQDQRRFKTVVNIGIQPSIENQTMAIEAHLLDFSEEIYHSRLHIDLHHFLRPEQKFDSLHSLVSQIQKDTHTARELLQKQKDPTP